MINTFVTQHCMLKTLDGHVKEVGNVNLLCTLWASNVILLCTLYMITRSRTEKESEEEAEAK